jgi:hypothetical protein
METLVKFKASDIYHAATRDEDIANTPIEKVFEWVRIGAWKHKHFKRWLKVIRVIE